MIGLLFLTAVLLLEPSSLISNIKYATILFQWLEMYVVIMALVPICVIARDSWI